jgi:hypothetical protein
MIKMMILAPRRPGLSHSAFRDYVTNVHGPLVKSVTEVAADIRAYHYNFPLPGAVDEAFHHPIAPFDIFTQSWFDSVQAQIENMKHRRYLEIVRPDEGRFADEARARFHYTREVELVHGPPGERKVFYVRRRRPDLSRFEFQTRWQEQFPRVFNDSSIAQQVIKRYVQNVTLPEADHPNGADSRYFDVIDEFTVASPGAWGTLRTDPALRERATAVERELLDTDRTWAFVTETVVNI